jgi:TonB-like protein
MIPRILVPRDLRPVTQKADEPPRRLTTLLDERTVIAANLPRGSLDTRSSIPAHLPLEVLASRVVVPRDTPLTPFDSAALHPDYAPVTVLDQRIIVPAALPFVVLQPKGRVAIQDLPDVLEPDVITTGEINLMVEAVEAPPRNWNLVARAGGVALHLVFIGFLLLQSRLFPYRPPTQQQIDMARQQLSFIYMPPDVRGLPPATPAPRSPQIRIDPRVFRQLAPPVEPQPLTGPKEPEHVVRDAPNEQPPELPPAPKPQVANPDKSPDFLRGPDFIKPQPQRPNRGLILPPTSSPGRALEQSAEESRRGGAASEQFGGPLPGGGGAYGGGGGEGYLNGAVQMLTPTEGVDFTDYLARVVASVKRNWFSVMPESAQMGDRGRVVLQFRIMRNGAVPDPEPQLMSTSGKPPLDRAAFSSIRTSSPFQPLPPAFSGDFIELRFIFLYNLPLNTQ